MHKYELTMIFATTQGSDTQKKIIGDIEKLLEKGSKITETLDLGKKILAYPIRKVKEGNFTLLKLEITGAEAVEINKRLKNDETILRYLLVRSAKVSKKDILEPVTKPNHSGHSGKPKRLP